jgi:NAD(P)-dependent dehydrogenase (short-subunit alcohol dehydrogenase family)
LTTSIINMAAILDGQVALITGGGRGIGRAIAEGLAAAGASVAVVARSRNELAETVAHIERAGGRALAIPADVAAPGEVEQAVREVVRSFGPVQVLVNCAGLAGPIGPTWETDPAAWWRCVEVNVRGPMLCSHAVLPRMIAAGGGRIINIASGAGTRAIPYLSAYVTSKAALIRFTENLASEAAPHGVKVFAIEPGTVRTSMAESVLQSGEGQRFLPWLAEIFEQGRDMPPEPAARLVVALASGRFDILSGRFCTVLDDLDRLAAQVEADRSGDLQTLRLQGSD